MSNAVCEGITVMEMGSGSIAASMAGMILADNGARVIKLEPPSGDRFRRQHPSGFLVWNRGKESLVADLRLAEGQQTALNLAKDVDVIIEGFSDGVAQKWNLGYPDISQINPGVVYCSIRGFKSDGPFSHLKSYEAIIAAKSGLYSRGRFGFRPGPIYVNSPVASFGAGQMATAGIMSALLVRQKTGQGQYVEASLWQGLNPYDYFGLASHQQAQKAGKDPTQVRVSAAGIAASRFAPMGCSADGRWFITCTMLPHQAQALVRALDLADILKETRFKNTPFFETVEDAEAYDQLLWERFRELPSTTLTKKLLSENDVAFEFVRTSEEALDHPQVRYNGEVVEVSDPHVGSVQEVGPIARFSSTPARVSRSAPSLGETTEGSESTTPPFGTDDLPSHPLAGKTIVEFGYFFAMPFGVTMAAALGARVIKLENEHGDPMRRSFGELELGSAKVLEGKESLSLDMKSAEGRRIVRQLIERADVFILGFRPGVAERLGVDYETLREINPRLVYIHGGGYGSAGPYSHRPMYAQTASALAGGFDRHAGYWTGPEMSIGLDVPEIRAILVPRIQSIAEGDANAALAVLAAITLGIYAQDVSGSGQFVSSSMVNGNLWSLADDACRYEGKPALPHSDPDFYGLRATYRLYEASLGWIFLAATTEREWSALVDVLHLDALKDDPRFGDAQSRSVHDAELVKLLGEAISVKTAATWEDELSAVGVGCAEVYDGSVSDFTASTESLLAAGLTFEVSHPTFGRLRRHGLPVLFSKTPGRVAPSCLRGQHNDTILTELGYSTRDIAGFKSSQVVFD